MNLLWWKKKKKKVLTQSEAEKRLALIEQVLFPNFTTEIMPNGTYFHVDYSADSNLQGAIVDLEEGINTPQIHETLSSVLKNLSIVRKIVQAYPEMDSRAEYIIVDNKPAEQIKELDEYYD